MEGEENRRAIVFLHRRRRLRSRRFFHIVETEHVLSFKEGRVAHVLRQPNPSRPKTVDAFCDQLPGQRNLGHTAVIVGS
jgi:hypothetical protein